MSQTAMKVRGNHVAGKVLRKLLDGFIEFSKAAEQIVCNAVDANASEILITFFEQDGKRCVSFYDNGSGMDVHHRDAYTGLCVSTSLGDKNKHGQNGNGRLGFIHHGQKCVAFTKTPEEGVHSITLTEASMIDAWFPDRNVPNSWKPLVWSPVSVGIPKELRTTGSYITWFDLNVGTPNEQKCRTPEYLVENLADRLSPYMARIVRVRYLKNGKWVEQPLKPRVTIGKPIEGSFHGPQPLGDIHWNLDIVADNKHLLPVKVSSPNPVCAWEQFIAPFLKDARYSLLANEITHVLRHPWVMGRIEISSLNEREYVTNDRDGFKGSLLEDEVLCRKLLECLRIEIVPKVEAELGMKSDEIKTTDDETLIAKLCQDLHDRTGEKPSRHSVAKIELDHGRIELTPGETCVITIKNPKEGRYVWDTSACGGSLEPNTGTRVVYTAKKLGIFKLVVRLMGDVRNAPEAEVSIKIVDRLPMRFTQTSLHLDCKQERHIRLEHVPENAKLVWTPPAKWDGKLEIAPDKTSARIITGSMEGTFDVTVTDTEHEGIAANCAIHVEKDYEPNTRTSNTIDDTFVYEGRVFELDSSKLPGNPCTSILQELSAYAKITLNFAHPMYEQASVATRYALCFREIALRIAHILLPKESTQNELHQKAGEVTAKLMSKPAKRS
ncbi:MAG: ATP-binding protein [Candidatus Uhrbacteria bacterium]|nr:ATP-binding protein [Candidatus Uhrbacteria bacterium]